MKGYELQLYYDTNKDWFVSLAIDAVVIRLFRFDRRQKEAKKFYKMCSDIIHYFES